MCRRCYRWRDGRGPWRVVSPCCPWFTVPPIRVTTPPMIDSSTFSCHRHGAARCVGETLLQLRGALRRQRRGGRHLRRTDLLVLHQTFTIDIEEIRRQRQSAPRGEQQEELADRCCRLSGARGSAARWRAYQPRTRPDSRALAPDRGSREPDRQTPRARVRRLGIRLFVGYVEQRSRVSRCGGPHAHDVSDR